MKILILVFMLLYLSASCSNNNVPAKTQQTINKPEELNAYCKNKSIEFFSDKKKTPHNWVSLWRVDGDALDVKGVWQVDNIDYEVKCRIKQGLNKNMTLISIQKKNAD